MNKEYLKAIKHALVQTKDDFVKNMKNLKRNLNEIHQSNIEVRVIKNDELQQLLYELAGTTDEHELTDADANECLTALAEIEHGLKTIKKYVD